MASEYGSAANLNRPHDAELLQLKLTALAVSRAVLPENVGQLEGRPGHGGYWFLRGRPRRAGSSAGRVSSGERVAAMRAGVTAV